MENIDSIVQLARQALTLGLILSLPTVLTAGIIGLLIGIFQAVTQLQDQALSMAVKLIAVIAVLFLTGDWMGSQLIALFEKSLRAAFI